METSRTLGYLDLDEHGRTFAPDGKQGSVCSREDMAGMVKVIHFFAVSSTSCASPCACARAAHLSAQTVTVTD